MRRTFFFVCLVSAPILASLYFYPSFSMSAEPSPSPSKYAGDQTCESCHEDIFKNIKRSDKGALVFRHPPNAPEGRVCETCHGPGQEHVDSEGAAFGEMIRFAKNGPAQMDKRDAACLQCHEKRNLLFWQGSTHDMKDIGCTSCHKVHTGLTVSQNRKLLAKGSVEDTCAGCHQKQDAQQMRFSHHPLREGKMDCTSCHNPHGTVGKALIKANHESELCLSCHTQYRGPVLFEHPPVKEQCSNCHVAHGSNYDNLLKLPEIRLCRQCHINFHGVNAPENNKRHLIGRLCTDCHTNVHGSNHPAGFNFTR